jgi:hypothetical protein
LAVTIDLRQEGTDLRRSNVKGDDYVVSRHLRAPLEAARLGPVYSILAQ